MHKTTIKAAKIVFFLTLLSNLLAGQTFLHDMDEAKNLAEKTARPIALVFSGSDWCKPCIQLRSNILEDDSFIQFAEEKLILVMKIEPIRNSNTSVGS